MMLFIIMINFPSNIPTTSFELIKLWWQKWLYKSSVPVVAWVDMLEDKSYIFTTVPEFRNNTYTAHKGINGPTCGIFWRTIALYIALFSYHSLYKVPLKSIPVVGWREVGIPPELLAFSLLCFCVISQHLQWSPRLFLPLSESVLPFSTKIWNRVVVNHEHLQMTGK